jgi:GNAT superfamily N-acetyltransferase
MPGSAVIRPVRPAEIEVVLRFCAEHAAYEGADFSLEECRSGLARSIFERPHRLSCFVAEVDGEVAGYATCTKDLSTWRAAEYIHMDCLYLTPAYRNAGLGKEIMSVIARHADSLGCRAIEWQTPASNANAIRFYQKLGAIGSDKVRFRWNLPARSCGGVE